MSVKSSLIPQRKNMPGSTNVDNHKIMLIASRFFTTGGIESKKDDLKLLI